MITFRRNVIALVAIIGLVIGMFILQEMGSPTQAQANSQCEVSSHYGHPNTAHLTDWGCWSPYVRRCGTGYEIYVMAAFTGFGIADSYATVQMWAQSGGGTQVTFSRTLDFDNKYMKLQTNWNALRWGSVDGSGFSTGSFGNVTLTFGCANNTVGSHYSAVGNV